MEYKNRHLAVPSNQIERLFRFGLMSVGVAGNVAFSASTRALTGKKVVFKDLLISDNNIRRAVKNLSQLRGAALKIGQLLSLEAGDVLPKHLSAMLRELQNNAYIMPPEQLKNVLSTEWNENFLSEFSSFDINPIAAASIGQVHKCISKKFGVLAVKVQYPGVKKSIDSDVQSMRFVLKRSQLFPKSFPLDIILDEGRKQLKRETDYIAESKQLTKYSEFVKCEPFFCVPKVYPDLTTNNILTMEFKEGITVDKLEFSTREIRNKVVEKLISLILREIFEFKLIQSDPNFANFLYNDNDDKLTLLDFGATINIETKTVLKFQHLLQAIFQQDADKIKRALHNLDLINDYLSSSLKDSIVEVVQQAAIPIIKNQCFNFTDEKIFSLIKELGKKMFNANIKMKLPPVDILLIQRKIGGIFLLGRRLQASVNMTDLLKKYLT